jgi:hypothetical protein
MVGHPKRDPPSHGVPDQAYRQIRETRGQLIKRPARVLQRRLLVTIPATYGVPKGRQGDSTLSGAKYAAAKGKDPQNRGIEGSNRKKAVRSATVQEKHDRLSGRAITGDGQAGRRGHTVRLFGVPVNRLGPIYTTVT